MPGHERERHDDADDEQHGHPGGVGVTWHPELEGRRVSREDTAAHVYLGQAYDEPREQKAEASDARDVEERGLRHEVIEDHAHIQEERAADDGEIRDARSPAEPREEPRRGACLRQRVKHSRARVEPGVHAGERGGDDHEVHDVGGRGDPEELVDADEGACSEAHLEPRYGADQHGHGPDVEDDGPEGDAVHGARHACRRVLGLGRCNPDDLRPAVGDHHHHHGEEHACNAPRGEAAVADVVPKPDGGERPDPKYCGAAYDDEGHDGHDLDHGEPELELPE